MAGRVSKILRATQLACAAAFILASDRILVIVVIKADMRESG